MRPCGRASAVRSGARRPTSSGSWLSTVTRFVWTGRVRRPAGAHLRASGGKAVPEAKLKEAVEEPLPKPSPGRRKVAEAQAPSAPAEDAVVADVATAEPNGQTAAPATALAEAPPPPEPA